MRVEDSRHRHLDLVFLLLGLTQRRFPLLQEQICGVLSCKLLMRRKGSHHQVPVPDLHFILTQGYSVSKLSLLSVM